MSDAQAIAFAVRVPGGFKQLQGKGLNEEHFANEWKPIWRFVGKCYAKYGKVPSRNLIESRYDWVSVPEVDAQDLDHIVEDLQKRYRYTILLTGIEDVVRDIRTPDDWEKGITKLKYVLDRSTGLATNGHTHDPFASETVKRIIQEAKTRRKNKNIKIGIDSIDVVTGGLQQGRLIIVAGRPGAGKSQVALNTLAHAIRQGRKVLMYSLEMSEYEVLGRLYTLLSRQRLGPEGTLRNMDFHTGAMKPRKLFGTIKELSPHYKGKFLLADFSTACTLEQIDADIEAYQPDMVWIDYLTLMPRPRFGGEAAWETVGALSGGLKKIALKRNVVVGACAQLNRAATMTKTPGVENLAQSDAVGQDADVVIFVAGGKGMIKMSVEKNRCGPRLDPISVLFAPDEGLLMEMDDEDEGE